MLLDLKYTDFLMKQYFGEELISAGARSSFTGVDVSYMRYNYL